MQALTLMAAAAAALAAPTAETFGWREGVVYSVTARPGQVTDIALEPGETLSAVNPVAAGDTVRWIIGDSESGEGSTRQAHVLLKPTAVGLSTSLFIATTRRTYHLVLRSGDGAYAATVAWRYPEGELVAVKGKPAPAAAPVGVKAPPPDFDLSRLNFSYRLEGEAPFRPVRVFDDGRRMVIDFPPAVARGEMPPLFELSPKGDAAQLVNYRVVGQRIVVDRLLDSAELRLGAGKGGARVRIVRDPR